MKRGFTLIELLVVIAIIAILAAILFPVFARAREKARQTACLNNVKQMALALQMYAQDYDETICYAQHRFGGTVGTKYWYQVLDPYIKNEQIHVCPSKNADAATTVGYGWNYPGMPYRLDLGPSSSASLAYWNYPSEVLVFACNQATNNAHIYSYISYSASHWAGEDTGNVGTVHNGGSNVGFLDGHAKWLNIQSFQGTDEAHQRLWGAVH